MQPKKVKGKTLNPPVAVASDMSAAVIEMITAMNKDIKRTLRLVFADNPLNTAMDGNVASQARIEINALMTKWVSRFDELAKYESVRMVMRTKKQAKISVRSSLREIAKHLTVDMTQTNAAMKDVIIASTQQAAQLIKLIPSEYLGEVQGEVMRSITTGKGMSELVPYLTKKYEGRVKWARHVAVDQTNKTYQAIARTQVQALGVEEFEWLHTGGSMHPRKEHIALSGKRFRFDDPPLIDSKTGQHGMPGDLPFCLPEWSNVEITNGINKLYRRRFTGHLSKLVTEDGSILEATANHPVFTQRGWIAIHEVQVGDYIVKAGAQSINTGEGQEANFKACVSDLFDSAVRSIGVASASTSRSLLEFHGDISDGEVEVVNINGSLPDELDSSFCKHVCELILTFAKDCRIGIIEDGLSSANQTLLSAFGTPDSIVRSLCSIGSLLRSHAAHAYDVRRALATYLNASFDEAQADARAMSLELLGQLQFTDPANVEPDNLGAVQIMAMACRAYALGDGESSAAHELGKIVGVDADLLGSFLDIASFPEQFCRVIEHSIREDFSGHVFNLETKTGWYSSAGFIVHNCRCKMRPVFKLD